MRQTETSMIHKTLRTMHALTMNNICIRTNIGVYVCKLFVII